MNERSIKRIYTDGACSGNPGPGGWGTVVYFSDGQVHELGGGVTQTTNNRMEMQAAIAALEYLLTTHQTEPVTLFTDSEYVKNGVTQWIKGWKQKGWKTSTGKAVLNQDLWQTIDGLLSQIRSQGLTPPQWQYVRGHSGDVGNERCDTIARAFALGRTPALQRLEAEASFAPIRKKNPVASDVSEAEAIQSTEAINQSDRAGDQLSDPINDQVTNQSSVATSSKAIMVDSTTPSLSDGSDLPREVRVSQLRSLVETLHMADEIAKQGYLITSSELADLMDVNASAVTSRGDNWVWRNWVVSRVRREGNQILWQLERVD